MSSNLYVSSSDINNYLELGKKNGLVTLNNKEKRLGYIEWDEYFMAMTFLELKKCIHKSDAAIILNQRKIIISMANSTGNADLNEENSADVPVVHHAEYKAICKIQQGEGTVMYTTSFPCEKCAESLVDAGISEIIYYWDSVHSNKAKEFLDKCGTTYRQFVSKKNKIVIDFSEFYDK